MNDPSRPTSTVQVADPSLASREAWLDSHEVGFEKKLKKRHVQMIAIGGAIGTGLFLGAGSRLQIAGPALAIAYLICGVFAFFVLRALGELIMHRPATGSFVSYAREFIGERASFVAGWIYFAIWALGGIVDITAVAIYMKYWSIFADVPQWVFALGALVTVTAVNMASVRWFGELEFWFALIKVVTIALFLIIGTYVLASGAPLAGHVPGLKLVSENGGVFPHGLLPAIIIMQGVIFAYASIELIGTAAGEAENPREVMPKAINSVMWRIGLFYVGSVTLLVLLLPWTSYSGRESPFVTFFDAVGIPGAGSIMNFAVLTAALSSLNSGLYANGRTLRSLAMGGSAPMFLAKLSGSGVPYRGILLIVLFQGFGVFLNYIIPTQVFDLLLNISALGVLSTWAFIVVCQMRFRNAVAKGEMESVPFRLPGAPYTAWLTLMFLAGIIVMTAMDYPGGTLTVAMLPFVALILYAGWRLTRRGRGPVQSEMSARDGGWDSDGRD